jgi:hypothetical protein
MSKKKMLGIVLLTLGIMLVIVTAINYYQVTSDFTALDTNNRQNLINKNWLNLTDEEIKILKAIYPIQWFAMISVGFLLILIGSMFTIEKRGK